MNVKKIEKFVTLLGRQQNGDLTAVDELHKLDVKQSDGQWLFDLYGEWKGAFSYKPGRLEIITPLLNMAKWLQKDKSNYLQKHDRSEWSEILELRGPVETVIFRKCSICNFKYPSMGTSGFYDAAGLICFKCGDVYFKSFYDQSEPPACKCGGTFTNNWPCFKCSNDDYKKNFLSNEAISPYEYFSKHSFSRGKDA